MPFTRKETAGLDSGTVPGSPTALRRLICPKTNTEPLTISLRLIVERGLRTNSRVPAAAAVLRVELHDRLLGKLDRTAEIVCIKDRLDVIGRFVFRCRGRESPLPFWTQSSARVEAPKGF